MNFKLERRVKTTRFDRAPSEFINQAEEEARFIAMIFTAMSLEVSQLRNLPLSLKNPILKNF